jgi:hypothetical protein
VAQQIKITLLFGLLAAYHWQALRADGSIAERSLAKRHAQFPVLVFAPGEIPEAEVPTPLANESGIDGDFATPTDFAAQIVNALQRQAPALPVAIHPISQGAPDETLSTARAVILPAELIAKPPEAIRLWLQSFPGPRLVLPTPARGWRLVAGGGQSLSSQARQTAQIVRQLAEGETPSPPRENSPLLVLVYVLAGLFLLELFLGLVGLGASLILR